MPVRTARVVFDPAAERDLFAIYEHIAEAAGLRRAGLYVDRITAACMALSTFPERGTPRDDLSAGVRTIGFERRATIAYRVEGALVIILGVFYAGRDFESFFQES